MTKTLFRSPFMQEASARGFVYQCTHAEELDALMCQGPITAYIGFDPTADCLHVGSLIQIMILRLLQRHGHKVIALIGGGTAKIGDPSFREESRQLMTEERIQTNQTGIEACLRQFLSFNTHDVRLVNNADWLDHLMYIDVLRDVGIHFSVNRMLSFDSVRSRLDREQGLTFLEFNYSILQAYDFRELSRRYGVCLQLGGSDQWGNIVSGVELIRRTDQTAVMGLTTPLLTTASGEKMGKTANGAIWLSPHRMSAFDYWQFWRNTADADVSRFLRLFTELPLEECAQLDTLQDKDINQAKIVLATEATALCHGRIASEEAAAAARQTFAEGQIITEGLPTYTLSDNRLKEGVLLVDILTETGLTASKSEARRLIRNRGARLNTIPVKDENQILSLQDMLGEDKKGIRLSAGRKRHLLIKREP